MTRADLYLLIALAASLLFATLAFRHKSEFRHSAPTTLDAGRP